MAARLIRTALFILLLVGLANGYEQYCHNSSPQSPFVFCLRISSLHNSTTKVHDWIVTFGYQKTYDAGWAALGVGSAMQGSLIFTTYNKRKSKGDHDLVLSVRKGLGYFEPRPITNGPITDILGISLNKTHWFQTSFACYGCETWLSSPSRIQPWIWAVNTNQIINEASEETNLRKHGYYGYFQVDMNTAIDSETPTAHSFPIHLDPSRPNAPYADDVHSYHLQSSVSSFPFNIVLFHGILLATSFALLLPLGALLLQKLSKNGFAYHLHIQLTASVCTLSGILFMLYQLYSNKQLYLTVTTHGLFGMYVLFSLAAQAYLGHAHHTRYVQQKPRNWTTYAHVWNGRLVIIIGNINIVLGLQLAGARSSLVYGAMVCLGVNVISVAISCFQTKHGKQESRKDEILLADDMRPFLKEDSD